MPLADAAAARDDPSSTWAIAKMRQATRPSGLRDASRRSFCADSSSRVTSILHPMMSSVRSCRPATENLTFEQMGTSKSYKSQEYRRLVLLRRCAALSPAVDGEQDKKNRDAGDIDDGRSDIEPHREIG